MYTYLLLNLITISFPLIRSFEKKIYFVGKWRYLFPAITITGSFFIIWDHYFTTLNIWSFNPSYIIGWYFFSLPLEELLFFLSVPFACVFIYEVVNYFLKDDPLKKISNYLVWALAAIFLAIALYNVGRFYTLITFSLSSFFLVLHWFVFKTEIFGKFFITYLIHLLPFFLVNGVLTYLPVVIYNDEENLGIRLFTIPIEDSVYSMLLLLINISIYEYFKRRKKREGESKPNEKWLKKQGQ